MTDGKRKRLSWGRYSGLLIISLFLGYGFLTPMGGLPWQRSRRVKRAKGNATKIEMVTVKTALSEFEDNVGRFPTTAEGLRALMECPSGVPMEKWKEKYIDFIPKDAWGREFRYACPSQKKGKDYDLTSAGPDGNFGTRDDITNDPPSQDDNR